MNRSPYQGCQCGRNTNNINYQTGENNETQGLSVATTSTGANRCGCDDHDSDFAFASETNGRYNDRDNDCDRCGCSGGYNGRDNGGYNGRDNGGCNGGCNGCDNGDETACSGVFSVEGCCDFVQQNIGTLSLSGVGQVINASLTLCNVCPNRTVALGVTLAEIDRCGCETNIAFKTFEITTPKRSGRNIKVRDIIFVVPKNNDNSNGKRCFRLHATANYLDTNVCI